jgi:hypothetical protein
MGKLKSKVKRSSLFGLASDGVIGSSGVFDSERRSKEVDRRSCLARGGKAARASCGCLRTTAAIAEVFRDPFEELRVSTEIS